MRKGIRVLVGDDSLEYGRILGCILKQRGFDVITKPNDGVAVMEGIALFSPDFAIIDAIMPHIDAYGMIKCLNLNAQFTTQYIVTANIENPVMQKDILQSGALHFCLKPFDLNELADRVCAFASKMEATPHQVYMKKAQQTTNLEVIVTDSMREIGVPAHIKGYQYIRDAVVLAIRDIEIVSSITKVLYPTVARMNKTTSSRVERAIRHAIDVAWTRGDLNTHKTYFGNSIQNAQSKPTNSEFIATLSDKIRLKLREAEHATI